jgi:hypothetical protein
MTKESEGSENERKKRAAHGGIEHFGRGYYYVARIKNNLIPRRAGSGPIALDGEP